MKFTLLVFTMASMNAMACPDISGSYISAENLPIKYIQQECKTLTRFMGEIDRNGNVKFDETGLSLVMNGKPNCGIRNFCTTVTPHADRIEVTLNFNSGVRTDEHGQCSQTGYDMALDKDGNLVADFQVTNCEDKFKGTARKTFKKL